MKNKLDNLLLSINDPKLREKLSETDLLKLEYKFLKILTNLTKSLNDTNRTLRKIKLAQLGLDPELEEEYQISKVKVFVNSKPKYEHKIWRVDAEGKVQSKKISKKNAEILMDHGMVYGG